MSLGVPPMASSTTVIQNVAATVQPSAGFVCIVLPPSAWYTRPVIYFHLLPDSFSSGERKQSRDRYIQLVEMREQPIANSRPP